MECTTKVDPGQGYEEGSLGAAYRGLKDQRAKRGIRYALAPLLIVMTLATLCGEDEPKAIAEWVSLRSEMLKALLKPTLSRPNREKFDKADRPLPQTSEGFSFAPR